MRKLCIAAICLGLAGCATASPVMDAGDGTYMISARASWARGGATGANTVAYEDAQKYCVQKAPGSHAIVVSAQERDVYQSGFGGSAGPSGASFGGGTAAAGNTNLRFRCGQ